MPIRVMSKDEKKYRDKVKKLKEGKATTGLRAGGSPQDANGDEGRKEGSGLCR